MDTGALCIPNRPCLSVVIDDVGRTPGYLRALLELPIDLTFAVLPDAPHRVVSIAALRAKRRTYLLHLPLAPEDAAQLADEKYVISDETHAVRYFDRHVGRVPGLIGVNTHMGSAATADPDIVRALAHAAGDHKLWILDSRTTADTQVCAVARENGVSCLERDVFLDDPQDPVTVDYRLQEAAKLARDRGWAIAIGHPRQETVRALRSLAQHGADVELVPLSVLYEHVGPRKHRAEHGVGDVRFASGRFARRGSRATSSRTSEEM